MFRTSRIPNHRAGFSAPSPESKSGIQTIARPYPPSLSVPNQWFLTDDTAAGPEDHEILQMQQTRTHTHTHTHARTAFLTGPEDHEILQMQQTLRKQEREQQRKLQLAQRLASRNSGNSRNKHGVHHHRSSTPDRRGNVTGPWPLRNHRNSPDTFRWASVVHARHSSLSFPHTILSFPHTISDVLVPKPLINPSKIPRNVTAPWPLRNHRHLGGALSWTRDTHVFTRLDFRRGGAETRPHISTTPRDRVCLNRPPPPGFLIERRPAGRRLGHEREPILPGPVPPGS